MDTPRNRFSELTYTFDQPLDGAGWHDREVVDDHGACRWMAERQASVVLPSAATPRSLEIHLRILMAIREDLMRGLRLTLNGYVIPLKTEQLDDSSYSCTGQVPTIAHEHEPSMRLHFCIPEVVTSFEDFRPLGLLFRRIDIKALEQSETRPIGPGPPPGRAPRFVMIGDIGDRDRYHVGDEAMFHANVREIRSRHPAAGFTGISYGPEWTADHYDIDAIAPFGFAHCRDASEYQELLDEVISEAERESPAENRWDTTAAPILEALHDADGLIVSGGGNLSLSWPAHVYERVALVQVARRFAKPVAVLGQTIGPRLGSTEECLVAESLSLCSFVGVREKASLAYAREIGVPAELLTLQLDDAFRLEACITPEKEAELPERDRPWILVTMTGDPELFGTELVSQITKIAELTEGYIIFVPHAAADNDHAIMTQVADAVDLPERTSVLDVWQGQHIAWLTDRASAVVSTRYHPIVFALSVNVPCLGIYSDEYTRVKVQGALAHAGLEGWSLPAEMASSGALYAAFQNLWKKRAAIGQHLKSMQPRWELAREAHWERVFRALQLPGDLAVDEGQGLESEVVAPESALADGEWVLCRQVHERHSARIRALQEERDQLLADHRRLMEEHARLLADRDLPDDRE